MADPPGVVLPDFCPYVGLQPFTVSDHAYFFGREKEQRVIAANLFAAPLTILYGPSAVGKSSVLQAGVASHLASEPRTATVYFASWQGDDYVHRLKAECERAIARAHAGAFAVDTRLPLDEWITSALSQFRGTLLLMLDQFEEYLLYHREEDADAFDAELARVVNRPEVGAHVLIGLRDDSLSKLNRFSKRIPNLLGNTLQLRRLSPEAARRAIVGPIDRYVEEFPDARPTRLDEPLVQRIIADVQIENVAASVSGGLGGVHASEDRGRIETAFLQLVLTELWRAASASAGDRVLDAETLDALGGAKAIVGRHVEREVGALTPTGQEIAARLFLHLVTPSGAKYALRTEDLVELAEHPKGPVTEVLAALAGARLLRRIDPPERYEIFHDAFAVALLDWRKRYMQDRLQEEAMGAAQARRREELRELTRRRRWQVLVGGGILLFAAIAVYAMQERRTRAELAANLQIATAAAQKSGQATEAATNAQQQAEAEKRAGEDGIAARELALKAERARLEGDLAQARDLEAQQAAKQQSADLARLEADRFGRRSQSKLAEATQTQARIDTLVKEAGTKGYPVSSLGAPAPAAEPATPEPTNVVLPRIDPPGIDPPKVEAVTATGDYREAYRRAIVAKDKRRWAEAQAHLETALRVNPKDTGESVNISGFGNVQPYLPHYYMGVMLRSQQKCGEALKQFERSEQDGAVQKTRLYKSLLQEREACRNKP